VSAVFLSRELALRYDTAWLMAHKLRHVLSERSEYRLAGLIEIDESYYSGRGKPSELIRAAAPNPEIGELMRSFVAYGFLAPPALFIGLCLAGALILPVWPRLGFGTVLVTSLCLFAAATPALSSYLLQRLEAEVPASTNLDGAQAIVVLSGEEHIGDGADIPDRLGPLSLERLTFAADAYRRLRLPVAVSGGLVAGAHTPLADLMKAELERDFAIPVSWSEDRSRTTYENAAYTAALLLPQKVNTVVLITHSWHLPRAIWSFERAGLHVLPWPVPRSSLNIGSIEDFLPEPGALNESFYAIHELIGLLYYRSRY
jgi:uncharacterized SAM-binding protein YcdF (DUF218 family)